MEFKSSSNSLQKNKSQQEPVYKFIFAIPAIIGRICKIKIQRILNLLICRFNTIGMEILSDTTYVPFT